MNKNVISISLISILIATGCNSNNSQNNTVPNKPNISTTTIIKSPNEEGGLEGNASNDTVKEHDSVELKEFLLKASDVKYYSYEITSKVPNNEAHFIDYFTPNAWYEENDNPDLSFGYAQERGTNAVFKYYLDGNNVVPSIYEYKGLGDEITKLTNLYDTWTIANINMLKDCMEDFSCKYIGLNKYLLTDSNTSSIFQYMTTYGSSITNFIIATYIDIINYDELIFKATIDLGKNGSIEAVFTPTNNTKINFVNDLVTSGDLKGVDYHLDVYDFFNNKMNTNNFVLHGIKQKLNGSESDVVPYTIHCTNDYFYLEYEDPSYTNWGYALVPAYTPITYYENGEAKTQTLEYTACYGFKKRSNGSFEFDYFKGPVANSNQLYKEVNELPETGEENTLYIIKENGAKYSYYYSENTWKLYGEWFNSVSDFYVNESYASFYLSGSALSSIGSLYFEKSLTNEDEYFSKSTEIRGALANGLFGWGFQATNTWMEYTTQANLKINRDSNSNITSYDIGLSLKYYTNGSYAGIGQIYYTIDSFGNGNVPAIDEFLNTTFGGNNNE